MKSRVYKSAPPSVHRAFVVQFGAETNMTEGCITGRVEHVASGHATQFHSLADLLAFITRVLAQVSR
ncbi:MAG: hypothetical protein ACE5LB_12985 [Acidiferrobacterales bacterium]